MLHRAKTMDAARAKAGETSLVFHEFAEEPSYLARSALALACSMSQSCAATLHTWDALQCMRLLCSALWIANLAMPYCNVPTAFVS